MNRVLKRIAMASGILFVLGIICTVLGVSLGGHVNYAFDLDTHEVYVPTKEEEAFVEKTIDVEEFENMDVQVDNMELEIKVGDSYQVCYHVPSWSTPTVEVQDKKLVVKNEAKKIATYGWNFNVPGIHINAFSESKESGKLTITVPQDINLTDMKVYSEFADVSITDIQSDKGDIKADSGDIVLQNMNIETAAITAGYGNVTMENFDGVTCAVTAESGACSMDTLNMDTLAVTADYGNVVMKNNEVITFALHAASGNVEIADMIADNSSIVAEYGKVEISNLIGKSCTIEAESGNCAVDTLQLDTLEIIASYGDVTVKDGEMQSITITAENGAIHVQDTKSNNIVLEDEYGNVLLEDVVLEDVNIFCENGNCDIGLIGDVDDYDMDITVDSGDLEINGEEQGNKYKSVSGKENSIVIQSQYGSVNVWIEE